MTGTYQTNFIAIEEDAVLDFQFSLIDAMNEAGITKADLAKGLGVSRARISQLLVSESNPTIKLVARAMAVVGKSLRYAALDADSKGATMVSGGRQHWSRLAIAAKTGDDEWAVEQPIRKSANINEETPYARAA